MDAPLPSEHHYDPARSVFCTVAAFRAAHPDGSVARVRRLVHCINPFPAAPGSEHDRAQRTTLRSVELARAYARLARPDLSVALAAVTAPGDPVPTLDGGWDHRAELARDIRDLMPAPQDRALPLLHDILTAVPVAPDDVFIFTNIDITLVPGFYNTIADLFRRGADAALVNRRTISDIHSGPGDIDLAQGEVGAPHPGFDCFAMRGSVRDELIAFEGCVGVGGVMLPLAHQVLALAKRPVVLLDAHATYHFGDDKQWDHPRFRAIRDHNRSEIDRVFAELTRDPDRGNRLRARLRGAHAKWVYPPYLRAQAGD